MYVFSLTQTASSLAKASGHYQKTPDMAELPELDASAIAPAAIGTPVAWAPAALKAMDAFGLPRELQRRHALQPRPRSVVRAASVELVEGMEKGAASGKPAGRQLLVGEPGCGKSTYLLQAVAHAIASGWAVVYVPRAIDWINSSTAYTYSPALQTYLQPDIATDLLKAMAQVNGGVLKRVKLHAPLVVDGAELFAQGTPLSELLKKVLAEHQSPVARQLALELVWASLAQQTDVPVLVAVDDVQALFGATRYRDADFAALQAYEMAVPRAFLSLLFAPQADGVKRGALLAALSMGHSEYPPSPELLVALREASRGEGAPVAWERVIDTLSSPTSPTRVAEPHAYTPTHPQHLENARKANLALLDVGERLSRPEAASLLDLMRRERMLWATPNDELFLGKLVESNGNIRVFERSWRSSLV